MGNPLDKLKESLAYRGTLGTLRFLALAPLNLVIQRTPLQHRLREFKDWRFDRRHNVDTDGSIQLAELDIDNPNREHGQRYEAVDPDVFRRMLAHLPIRREDFTFVDFGSGKGRALLLASEYPFRRIIGVEFSPRLNQIAERNVKTFRSGRQKCRDITAVCEDAIKFPLPPGDLLIFMANPFNEPVMARVLDNIRAAVAASPRRVFIIYSNPECAHLFERAEFLTRLTDRGWFSIYAVSTPAPADSGRAT